MLQVFRCFFFEWQRGARYMFFSSLKMSEQKNHEKSLHFFEEKMRHLTCSELLLKYHQRKDQESSRLQDQTRACRLSHTFNIDDFLGLKQKWAVSGYLGEDIFRPLPTIPSKKIGGVLNYLLSYIFHPYLGEDFQFDDHIFQMGGSIQPPTRPKTLRKKNTNCHAVNQPEKNAGKFIQSGYNWKNVHDDLEAGRVGRWWYELGFVEEVDSYHRIHGKMVYLPTFFGWLLPWWDFSPLMWRNREWCP